MDQETILAEDIRITEENVQCDAMCKQILSEKPILAWIMKSCVEEFRDFDPKEIAEKYIEGEPQVSQEAVLPDETNAPTKIRGLNTEDTSLTEGKVTYDIRFLATLPASNEMIRLIINVEAQGQFYPGYPLVKRGIYYCSRMISAQYNREFADSHYEDIKKVYSIWIAMNPPEGRKNSITRYRIVEENMVGAVKEPVSHYDLMTVVMVCLGNPEQGDSGILKLLNVLFSNEIAAETKKRILSHDFDIPITQNFEGRLRDMCNFSLGFKELGVREGIAIGKAEGIATSIKKLMKSLGIPVEKAMELLDVPENEQQEYRALLEAQQSENS